MQDIFENARRMANNAVERAAWEADKLRRASARQREGDLAERERTALLDQIARLVLDLDARGQLGNASLSALAQRLRTLDGEIEHARSDAPHSRCNPGWCTAAGPPRPDARPMLPWRRGWRGTVPSQHPRWT